MYKSILITTIVMIIVQFLVVWGLVTIPPWIAENWFHGTFSKTLIFIIWAVGIANAVRIGIKGYREYRAMRNARVSPEMLLNLNRALNMTAASLPSELQDSYVEDLLKFAIRLIAQDGNINKYEAVMLTHIFQHRLKKRQINVAIKNMRAQGVWDDDQEKMPEWLSGLFRRGYDDRDYFEILLGSFATIGVLIGTSDGQLARSEVAYTNWYIGLLNAYIDRYLQSIYHDSTYGSEA